MTLENFVLQLTEENVEWNKTNAFTVLQGRVSLEFFLLLDCNGNVLVSLGQM